MTIESMIEHDGFPEKDKIIADTRADVIKLVVEKQLTFLEGRELISLIDRYKKQRELVEMEEDSTIPVYPIRFPSPDPGPPTAA